MAYNEDITITMSLKDEFAAKMCDYLAGQVRIYGDAAKREPGTEAAGRCEMIVDFVEWFEENLDICMDVGKTDG
jgi:hypothetical protein